MFDYKFVSIRTRGVFQLDFEDDYKKIIQENAYEGWRFLQVVPVKYSSNGVPKEVEVVLERPSGWEESANEQITV